MSIDRSHALDHVVLVLFENRSLDNLLGRLYGPQDNTSFEGVVGKELTNPVPEWAHHQPPDGSGLVRYDTTEDMDAPNPDSGEEYYHTNTQLFGVLDEHNRFAGADTIAAPWNAPAPGATPDMSGFVADYISWFTWEMGRQPTFDEYRTIMTGYTPEQVPVLSGLARDFGVFDHWFCEVPSQTFMNRSFWTAATCSPTPTGGTVNSPISHWIEDNTAETLFDRLEAHGRSWKVYVADGSPVSFTGVIHYPRLRDRFATHFAPFSEFERDAAAGTLPDFALIEPNLMLSHGDYHPACGKALFRGVDAPVDPPSSILAGEAFLDRLYRAYRGMRSPSGANVWNTTLFIGWDEPGGTYDHVPPGPVPAPDPSAPAGQFGFTFDRSGYRVPAIVVSPWVQSGSVYSAEHRHTSMIATLRKEWGLGDPFTQRDASAATFEHVFSRETPRDPDEWAVPDPLPVPQSQVDYQAADRELSTLGKAILPGLIQQADAHGITLPPQVKAPDFRPTFEVAFDAVNLVGATLFPTLTPGGQGAVHAQLAHDLAAAVAPQAPSPGAAHD